MRSFGMAMSRVMYAGPTCEGIDSRLIRDAHFELRPPAKRGDIGVLAGSAPGLLVLVDGRFHQSLSVGHAEIRAVLDGGWVVWGLGSLGAIRAFEMRDVGMRGFGRVYEHFLGEEDFQDDEVALLHAPEPPYRTASEPLVHLRYLLAALADGGQLAHADARLIVSGLKRMWFGDRTLESTISLVEACAGAAAATAAEQLAREMPKYRVKTQDLADFLHHRVWELPSYAPTPRPVPYGSSDVLDHGAA
jgi:hypothetical protein